MNLTINLATKEVLVRGRNTRVTSISQKRRDSSLLSVVFVGEDGTTMQTLPAGHELTFGCKAVFGGSMIVSAANFEEPAGGEQLAENYEYVAYPSFNTNPLNNLFNPATKASVKLLAEFTWKDPGDTSSRTFTVLVENDVIDGTEGAPEEGAPQLPAVPLNKRLLGGALDGGGNPLWKQYTAAEVRSLLDLDTLFVTALTGGAAGSLDSIPTVGRITAGSTLRFSAVAGAFRVWQPQVWDGASAEDSAAGVVRPDDFHAVDNPLVWVAVFSI